MTAYTFHQPKGNTTVKISRQHRFRGREKNKGDRVTLKQVLARVISNEQVLGEFKRRRNIRHIPTRNIRGSWLMWLESPGIAHATRPGQFIMVRCGDCVLPRPFSIHQVDGKGNLALFYAVLEDGRGTGWLSKRRAGDTLSMFGPLGNGFSISPESRNLLLVAGGIGIAPLYFLAQEAARQSLLVTLLYGTANKERYESKSPLPSGLKLISTTEDGSVGTRGKVTDLLPELAARADQIFACGPLSMYHDIYANRERLLKGKPTQISLEVQMGCGFGVCYGCTIRTKTGLKQVCQDGPVFNLEDIVWDELR